MQTPVIWCTEDADHLWDIFTPKMPYPNSIMKNIRKNKSKRHSKKLNSLNISRSGKQWTTKEMIQTAED